ncbi:MAG: penicillin-binding protein 2 [Anaerolineaceae bacterium]|nr:penicillin-binding protein 2 [Anaerolineaceae bacterium]
MSFLKTLTRDRVLGILLTIFVGLVALQMIRIQTSAHAKNLNQWAENYGYELRTIQSERGYIYDRMGHLLAGNRQVYEMGVELQNVCNAETIASTLASQLGLDYQTVLTAAQTQYIAGKQVYMTLTDFVEADKINVIDALQQQYAIANPGCDEKEPSLSGLTWTAHLQRIYPENTLASNVLGFFPYLDREKGRGFFGVEEEYNDLLAGIKEQVLIPLDPYQMQEIPSAPAGASLILTIDRDIQRSTEDVLDKAIKSTGADNGTIIVMNPKNGEILAMASTPRMNPNEYWDYSKIFTTGIPFNKAISQVYEPGSVFKVLTMASALDAGAVKPSTPFTDTGAIVVGGVTIYNWDRGAWGAQDMVGCMQHSLNVCLSWVAVQLGASNFYQYLDEFNIGHRSNIDLAGEEVFPLSEPGDPMWYEVNLATNSFGQGVAVTPIQMVMAVSALANDGKMVAPHVLKAYIQNGKQYDTNIQVVGMPIKAETAKTITNMLQQSLLNESSDALVEGYSLAGKTGTAEIAVNGEYSSNQTNASFVGWGPTDDPQFLVYVWLEKPSSSIWGSVVAAPVFRDTVKELVVLMNIPPDAQRLSLKGQ